MISVNDVTIYGAEGTTSSNFGNFGDVPADTVSLSASLGTVVDNGDGTWSWNFVPSDDIASSQVIITAVDDDGGSSSVVFGLSARNGTPTLVLESVGEVNENGSVSLTGGISDPSTLDSFMLAVDWGDGSAIETFSYPAGTTLFSEPHQYLDDNPGDEYTITATLSDDDGGTSAVATAVAVKNLAPANLQIAADVPNYVFAVGVSKPFSTAVPFSDVGTLDTHTAVWQFTHAISQIVALEARPGTVTQNSGGGFVSDSFSFQDPGVYTVVLRVTDDDGGETASDPVTFVVYDPSEGFVTGGGWIDSPAGALPSDPSLVGRATFGFVSKYKKGATIPTGQTDFQFRAGSLNFSSTSYQWMVVAGARAQYKGMGTINGAGQFGFMLTAVDGQLNGGGGADKFRIKIWDLNTDALVYDNQLGASDDATPATALGGGQIIIHKAGNAVAAVAAASAQPTGLDPTSIPIGTGTSSTSRFNVGDVNGDATFDHNDLLALLKVRRYRTDTWATWEQGDWNGDGFFDEGDLILAMQSGTYDADKKIVDDVFAEDYGGSARPSAARPTQPTSSPET
jgi:hypothetical protein